MLQVTNASNTGSGPTNQVAVAAPAAGNANPTVDISVMATQGGSFKSDIPTVFIGSHLYDDETTVERDASDSSKLNVHIPQTDIRTGLIPLGVADGSLSTGSVNVNFVVSQFQFKENTTPLSIPVDRDVIMYANGIVASADFDGDQQPDQVVVVVPTPYVVLSKSGKHLITTDAVPLVVMTRVLDLDGDGNLDLVLAKGQRSFMDTTPDYVDVYLGPIVANPSDGAVFSSRVRLFDFSTVQISTSYGPINQTIAFADLMDLNNDGKLDILVSTLNPATQNTYLFYQVLNVSY
jgi:hypothetical protein